MSDLQTTPPPPAPLTTRPDPPDPHAARPGPAPRQLDQNGVPPGFSADALTAPPGFSAEALTVPPGFLAEAQTAPLGFPPDPAALPPDPAPVPPDPPALHPPSIAWRDQLASLAAGLDLSLVRLLGGAALLAVAAVVGWRLLAPPPAPAEMQLPMADRAALTGDARANDPTPSPAAPVTSAADTGEVVVHVVGAVRRPGVQHLPAGSRVVEAVDAAGGAAPDADLGRLNLAAVLADGQQVYVLRTGEVPPTPLPAPGTPGTGTPGAGAAPGPPVDLNQATAEQLDALPGIGPATAAAIIATRQEKGRFQSVDDLLDVRGIGDAKLAQLRDRVKV